MKPTQLTKHVQHQGQITEDGHTVSVSQSHWQGKVMINNGVCHNHYRNNPKKLRNPESPRDNTWQSLGLILSCNKVLMVDPE